MSDKFRQVDRETQFLLPPSLDDWLPEEHLARFVIDIVEQLDLSENELPRSKLRGIEKH
ncbi:hypothetical protein [uncultured Desulfuromonas sp.]|uniref:hypothetical protein n=1 Tax=uncultured Desulfuromonas sp. TaxID=181013 RepID=UPI002AAB1F79|nr:hypothetical protein [uncultured Desulfuromonas sp.]